MSYHAFIVDIRVGLLIAYLAILLACREKSQPDTLTDPTVKRKTYSSESAGVIARDTVIVDGHQFTIAHSANHDLDIVNSAGDTILKNDEGVFGFELKDFNGDGYKDFIISYFTNVPGIQSLLLYDKKNSSFRNVENFGSFPAPERLGNTAFYYSYHRAGCSDMKWESNLFYIDNFKVCQIGNIYGNECIYDSTDTLGIKVFRISGELKTLVTKMDISLLDNYKNLKFGFIKAYWSKRYETFR